MRKMCSPVIAFLLALCLFWAVAVPALAAGETDVVIDGAIEIITSVLGFEPSLDLESEPGDENEWWITFHEGSESSEAIVIFLTPKRSIVWVGAGVYGSTVSFALIVASYEVLETLCNMDSSSETLIIHYMLDDDMVTVDASNYKYWITELSELLGVDLSTIASNTLSKAKSTAYSPTSAISTESSKIPFDNLEFSNFSYQTKGDKYVYISGMVTNNNSFSVHGVFSVCFFDKNGKLLHSESVSVPGSELAAGATGVWKNMMDAIEYDYIEYYDDLVAKK